MEKQNMETNMREKSFFERKLGEREYNGLCMRDERREIMWLKVSVEAEEIWEEYGSSAVPSLQKQGRTMAYSGM